MNRMGSFGLIVWMVMLAGSLYGQDSLPSHLFRIYEDNDFLNIRGNGTDNAYTNGTRFDFFQAGKRRKRSFPDRWMPSAGTKSIDVNGWSLTQLMVTPNDISTTRYQPDDYPYAGALYLTYSRYSYNPEKKYSFHTALIAGIRGPASFAKEVQTYIHSVIRYQKPMGWDNQLNTYPLLNINFTAEQQILAIGQFAELIGGIEGNAGSFIDAVHIYPLIRIGKMAPYFNGYLSQYGSYYNQGRKIRTQYYFIVKPGTLFVLHNALLHGERLQEDRATVTEPSVLSRRIRHRLTNIEFGAVLTHGHFSLSYLQTHSTEYNQGLYHHNWGNISVCYQW